MPSRDIGSDENFNDYLMDSIRSDDPDDAHRRNLIRIKRRGDHRKILDLKKNKGLKKAESQQISTSYSDEELLAMFETPEMTVSVKPNNDFYEKIKYWQYGEQSKTSVLIKSFRDRNKKKSIKSYHKNSSVPITANDISELAEMKTLIATLEQIELGQDTNSTISQYSTSLKPVTNAILSKKAIKEVKEKFNPSISVNLIRSR
jgi:hypothetical protein